MLNVSAIVATLTKLKLRLGLDTTKFTEENQENYKKQNLHCSFLCWGLGSIGFLAAGFFAAAFLCVDLAAGFLAAAFLGAGFFTAAFLGAAGFFTTSGLLSLNDPLAPVPFT